MIDSKGATESAQQPDSQPSTLTLTRPDDWHLHLRDGALLADVLPYTANTFARAIVMPNLTPPVTTTALATAYRERICALLRPTQSFEPLMTLYLTDNTPPDEARRAKDSGLVHGIKLYPAGATTNSDAGVTDIKHCMATLETMAEIGLPLLIHGEVTHDHIDIFDREAVFIDQVLTPLRQQLPELKVVFEHITTREAAQFVAEGNSTLAATVTPQHLLLGRNALFEGGLRPHRYCLPVLKREEHRASVLAAVTGPSSHKFFLGTDSAPHLRGRKESDCGCAGMFNAANAMELYATAFEQAGALDKLNDFSGHNGPTFYGLPVNQQQVTLRRKPQQVPAAINTTEGELVPMAAGETLAWCLDMDMDSSSADEPS